MNKAEIKTTGKHLITQRALQINAKTKPVGSEATHVSIEGLSCKTYSISIIQGRGLSKIIPWSTG